MPTRWLLAHGKLYSCLLLAQLLAACNGSDVAVVNSPATMSPPIASPPLPPEPVHAHVRGVAAVGQAEFRHYVEGLLTADGEVRLYIGGPGEVSGVSFGAGIPPAALEPAEAMQFVGRMTWNGDAGSGQGVVIGQSCAPQAPGRFCAAAVPAEISIAGPPFSLTGEIRVDADQGMELWQLDIGSWSVYYATSSVPGYRGGIFSEHLAAFADTEALVINIDSGGRLFFQSPSSGCTGNGALTPHADGRFYVFDVDLLIENCNAPHAYLNGQFAGLATETQNGYWDYDSWLVMVLSTRDGTEPRLALAMISSGF